MPRKSQYNVKTGFQQAYDQDFNGTQTDIQLLTGRVTYLERFAPKPTSTAVPSTPPASGNSLYALRQHTHQAKDITSGVLPLSIGGMGGNDKNTARAGLGLGSAATYNVPQTGNAAANQVSLGSDGRFSDARVPLPHAASHATGQPDAITPASIGAANVSHTHAPADITGGVSGMVPLAALTGGGTTGSLTFTNGILTARVDPT